MELREPPHPCEDQNDPPYTADGVPGAGANAGFPQGAAAARPGVPLLPSGHRPPGPGVSPRGQSSGLRPASVSKNDPSVTTAAQQGGDPHLCPPLGGKTKPGPQGVQQSPRNDTAEEALCLLDKTHTKQNKNPPRTTPFPCWKNNVSKVCPTRQVPASVARGAADERGRARGTWAFCLVHGISIKGYKTASLKKMFIKQF